MKAERITTRSNDFEHLTDWTLDGVRVSYALRIHCHRCGEKEVAKIPNGLAYTCQQSMADRLWRSKGWMLGRKRSRDVCPACAQAERDERNARRIASAPAATLADVWPKNPTDNVIVIQRKESEMIQPKKPVLVEPREMTRADRRIILSKLEEVYLDEREGYDGGWSDQKVATDLGVPLAWVRTLRDENFGPEGLSQEARTVIADAKKVAQEIYAEREAFIQTMNAHQAAMTKLGERADLVLKKLAQIEKA